jgi:hypothetical protein
MKPLCPVEAQQRLNETVTVEMRVQRAKSCSGSCQYFLDSDANYRDPNNLGVVITVTGAARFKEVHVDDPVTHFKDKTIRIHGTVILKDNRPCIEVDDPAQIEVVK